jgi:hypothetical protein
MAFSDSLLGGNRTRQRGRRLRRVWAPCPDMRTHCGDPDSAELGAIKGFTKLR